MRLETTGQDCVIPPPPLELRLRGDQFSRGFPPLFLSTADIINTCCFSLQTADIRLVKFYVSSVRSENDILF